MDIRTKLIFALVAVSLSSMLLLGEIVSPRVERHLRDATVEQLDELAEAKQDALFWIFAGWLDRTDLVASRTQLRASVDQYLRSGSAEAVESIETILTDAIEASETATLLSVHDLDGRAIASVTRGSRIRTGRMAEESVVPPRDRGTTYRSVQFGRSRPPRVSFTAPLTFEDRTVGALLATFEAEELVELTSDYHGLGETGETLILAEDSDGTLRTLHQTRHGPAAGVGIVLANEPGSLARRALEGRTEPVTGGVLDYRGEEVWAATRLVPEAGWGLVLKQDQVEAAQPSRDFAEWLDRWAVILSAFVILAGFVLGLRFALPIQDLAEVASRLGKGDMEARADVKREDEVGLLARTLNEMAGELEERMALLREFRKFFEVSVDLMCIANTDGYFTRTNPAFTRELGWSPEELLERPFFDFVHPDDVEATEREVAKLAEGIPTISFENRYLCKDGTYKVLRWATYPMDGVLYAIAHVMSDASTA